ncbi:MAG: VTT domain-containing protein [Thalassovita sp.]
MTETLLALLPDYGAPFLAILTMLSCLALPIPASVVMMAAGGFAAAGELSLTQIGLGALIGALMGDQIGYQLGRTGAHVLERIEQKGGKQALALSKATEFTRQRGIIAVFLSRWLISPLGPYVNFVAGAARMKWLPFSAGSLAGEVTWVSIYVGLGAGVVDQFSYVWPMVRDGLGVIAATALSALLIVRLRILLRSDAEKLQTAPADRKGQTPQD